MTDYQLDHRPSGTIEITTAVPLETMQQFLRLHGLDANDVPCPTTVTVADGQLTVETYVRGAASHIVLDGSDAARQRNTVQLRAPWPPQDAEVDGRRG